MAGKRIAIYGTESKIIEGDYGDFYNTISRTEAVERMANAMSDTYFNDVHACEPDMLEKMAEAALDALIKGV